MKREIKENDGVGKLKYDIFVILEELCGCHDVSLHAAQLKK
jgi:hypothetical protein